MYVSICNAPLLQPKQSWVHARLPYRKDVFSLLQNNASVSDPEVTIAESSIVLGRKQQICV